MLSANCQKLYDFLDKWYQLFEDDNSTVSELLDKSFEEKCEEFAFYPDYDRVVNEGLLTIEGISNYIEDSDFELKDAASILFGRWHFYRYGTLNKSGIIDSMTRRWFLIVLDWILGYISYALEMEYGDIVSCKIKTTIFETGYKKNDGIEEILTIKNDGNIKHSLKKDGCKAVINHLSADSEKVNDFINRLPECFVIGDDPYFEGHFGNFDIEFTDSEKRKYCFDCGLRRLKDKEGNDLSKVLRQLCDTDELLAFDGRLKLIDKLHLVYCSDSIKEELIVEREKSSLCYTQYIDDRKFNLSIEDRDIKPLFNYLKPDNFILCNTDSLRTYTVNLVLADGQELSYYGSYDADSLTEEFVSFIESIGSIIDHYAKGDIFAKSIYSNARKKKGDYMLCKVLIKELRKVYYYLSIEDNLCTHDEVLVPGIDDDKLYIGTVKEINFCNEKELPYPLDSMRYIERRSLNGDYEFMDEMFY